MVDIKKINKASNLVKSGDFDSAEKIYYELLRDNPNNETVMSFWGLFQLKKGNFNKAEKILERAYNLKKSASTIAALAMTKYHNKRYDDAIILYEELFRFDKDSPRIFFKIILAFKQLGMYDFAHAYCMKFLQKHPTDMNALVLMTQNSMDMGNYNDAEEYCRRTMELYPDNPSNWIHAGLLQELKYCNDEVAQECYRTAIANGDKQGYYHLAVSLEKVKKYDEALECFHKCIEYNVDLNATIPSLGILQLKLKDFENGYKNFMQREVSYEIASLKNRWVGKGERSISKENTVLVYCDQGFGDCFNFVRYLPILKEKFNKVIVYCKKPVLPILARNFSSIDFISDNLDKQTYDVSILITDLPYYLSFDFDNIPTPDKYLEPDKSLVEKYRSEYFNTDKLKVGLCWKAGGMGIRAAINRTINIDYFKPLFDMKNVEFYSFQKEDIFDGCKKYPKMIDLGSTFESFEDTAAAMENLDLMVSADTVTLHIAGAMGKSAILLIPYCPDWRWFDNEETTEWYSSVKILKQQDNQDWYIEVEKLKEIINNSL